MKEIKFYRQHISNANLSDYIQMEYGDIINPFSYDNMIVYLYFNKINKKFYLIHFCYEKFGDNDILISEELDIIDVLILQILKS